MGSRARPDTTGVNARPHHLDNNDTPSAVSLRHGTVADLAELRQQVLGWRQAVVPHDDTPGVVHVVAVANETVIGGASSGVQAPPDELLGSVGARSDAVAMRFWGVAVMEDWRHHGIGRELMAAVRHEARVVGATVLWANARTSALSFYVDLGFTVVGEVFHDPLSGLPDQRVAVVL